MRIPSASVNMANATYARLMVLSAWMSMNAKLRMEDASQHALTYSAAIDVCVDLD